MLQTTLLVIEVVLEALKHVSGMHKILLSFSDNKMMSCFKISPDVYLSSFFILLEQS